jgi:hypothetical protein
MTLLGFDLTPDAPTIAQIAQGDLPVTPAPPAPVPSTILVCTRTPTGWSTTYINFNPRFQTGASLYVMTIALPAASLPVGLTAFDIGTLEVGHTKVVVRNEGDPP